MDQSPSARQPNGSVTDDDTSLVEIASIILRNWRLIVVLPVSMALAVGLWTMSQDRTYSAYATFLPQTSEVRGAGGAAALAQQFGLNLGTERTGQSPQFYVDILQSLAILRAAVESEYNLPGPASGRTLVEIFMVDTASTTPPWLLAVEHLRNDMSTSIARETGIVRLGVSAAHPALAEQIVNRLLHLLNEFNMETRQSNALEEGRFISGRLAEAEAELLAAERALEEFLRQNREFRYSPELLFAHDRLQRQVALRHGVYTSLLHSQEQTRIDAVRDTPLLTIIDLPNDTAQPDGRGTVTRAVLAFMIGLVIAVVVALVSEFVRRNRDTSDPRYREFQVVFRQAWADIRRPSRWLRQRR